jgi:DNA adenine methylase
MIKSPLRYPGGKSRAVELIASLTPDYQAFREPFVGGGSVFIHQKQQFPNRSFWINDLYFDLFNFWHKTQSELEALIEQINKWKLEFTDGRVLHRYLLDNLNDFNDLDKAAAFFIFNRLTFSGTTLSGGYSEQAFNKRFTPSSVERLADMSAIMNGIKITNVDYEEVVLAKGNDVFIFLDPPYFSATKSALYGKNGSMHKGFDHERFAETMKQCPHNWLMTYDDCAHIRELFDFAHIQPWDLMYGMKNVNAGTDQKGKELFISNFLDKMPDKKQLNLF